MNVALIFELIEIWTVSLLRRETNPLQTNKTTINLLPVNNYLVNNTHVLSIFLINHDKIINCKNNILLNDNQILGGFYV